MEIIPLQEIRQLVTPELLNKIAGPLYHAYLGDAESWLEISNELDALARRLQYEVLYDGPVHNYRRFPQPFKCPKCGSRDLERSEGDGKVVYICMAEEGVEIAPEELDRS